MIAELTSSTSLLLPSAPVQQENISPITWDKMGVVRNLLLPAPPDEKQIAALNELASKAPFNKGHRTRKYDML